jgi:hypothetical protein
LNERQKNKIAEALQNTNTIEETKTIYETLQSAVQNREVKRAGKSLTEAVSGRMSPFLVRENNNQRKEDVMVSRLQKLAGIKK